MTLPRRGSTSLIASISSPKNSTRIAVASSYAGKISTTSPRTRKVPRWKSTSLREYWMSTSLRSSSSRRRSAPRSRLVTGPGWRAAARAALELEERAVGALGGADAVDAAHRGDDDHVRPGEERVRRRVPHPVDGVVDDRVLLDVRVARGDVRLGLVVVVVADEILDGVVGEQIPELAVELGGERL